MSSSGEAEPSKPFHWFQACRPLRSSNASDHNHNPVSPISPGSPTVTWCAPIAAALARKGGRPCLTGLHGSTAGFALTQLVHPQSAGLASQPWLIVTKSEQPLGGLIGLRHNQPGLRGESDEAAER